MKQRNVTFPLILFLLYACGLSEAAGEQGIEKVWSIGKKNKAYAEFSAMPAAKTMEGYSEKYPGGFDIHG